MELETVHADLKFQAALAGDAKVKAKAGAKAKASANAKAGAKAGAKAKAHIVSVGPDPVASGSKRSAYDVAKTEFAGTASDWMHSDVRRSLIQQMPVSEVKRRRFQRYREDAFKLDEDGAWMPIDLGDIS